MNRNYYTKFHGVKIDYGYCQNRLWEVSKMTMLGVKIDYLTILILNLLELYIPSAAKNFFIFRGKNFSPPLIVYYLVGYFKRLTL